MSSFLSGRNGFDGYAHDEAGNVETISGLPKPDFFPRLTDLTYAANRMATQNTDWIGAGVVLPSPAAVYSYDAAGNITSDGLHTDHFYNQNNRLIRVEIDGLTVAEYAYDAFERRVKKVVNGVTTHFHYDLNGLLISETDGNGNPRKDYVYLNGEPVAMKVYGESAGWYWFVNDHLGTPQKMVDAAGSVVWAAAYAPFGEAGVYQDELVNNLRFPGQYYDGETGLHYNWHRYYDPGTGRYLTPDPIGLAGGTNLYTYVRNNPPNSIDPLGLIDLVDDVLFDPDDPLSVPGPFFGGGGGGGFRGFGSGRFKNIFGSQSNVGKSCSSVSKRGYRVNWGQQEKHFPGHNSYTPGRSTMTNDPSRLSQKAGTGKQIGKKPIGTPGSKERIDFGEKIGTYIDEAGNSSPTTKGILHYGKKGIHIVPARPK